MLIQFNKVKTTASYTKVFFFSSSATSISFFPHPTTQKIWKLQNQLQNCQKTWGCSHTTHLNLERWHTGFLLTKNKSNSKLSLMSWNHSKKAQCATSFFQTNFSFFKINPKRIKVRKSHFLTKLRKELFYACVEEANYKTIVKFTLNFLLVQLLVILLSYPRSFNVKAAIVKNSETRPGTKANHFLLSYLSRFSTWKVLKPRLGFLKGAASKNIPNLRWRWWYPWPCKGPFFQWWKSCPLGLGLTKMPTKSVLL